MSGTPQVRLPVEIVILYNSNALAPCPHQANEIRGLLRGALSLNYAGTFEVVIDRKITPVFNRQKFPIRVLPPPSELVLPLRIESRGARFDGVLNAPLNASVESFYMALCQHFHQEPQPMGPLAPPVLRTCGYAIGAEIKRLPRELLEGLSNGGKTNIPPQFLPLQFFLSARINPNDLSFTTKQVEKGFGADATRMLGIMLDTKIVEKAQVQQVGCRQSEVRWIVTEKGRAYIAELLLRCHPSAQEQKSAVAA